MITVRILNAFRLKVLSKKVHNNDRRPGCIGSLFDKSLVVITIIMIIIIIIIYNF